MRLAKARGDRNISEGMRKAEEEMKLNETLQTTKTVNYTLLKDQGTF